jgi:hypothetical protein
MEALANIRDLVRATQFIGQSSGMLFFSVLCISHLSICFTTKLDFVLFLFFWEGGGVDIRYYLLHVKNYACHLFHHRLKRSAMLLKILKPSPLPLGSPTYTHVT